MEPHSQACGTACYVHTGDILSKEHLPTAKPVVLCVEGEKHVQCFTLLTIFFV